VALVGALGAHAPALAERLPEVEVVAIGAETRAQAERERVSRLVSGPELPFHPWTFRALAAAGDALAPEEAVRVVARGGRVVCEQAGDGVGARLEGAGCRVLASEGDWIVALRETR
jgi:hypothetical protein